MTSLNQNPHPYLPGFNALVKTLKLKSVPVPMIKLPPALPKHPHKARTAPAQDDFLKSQVFPYPLAVEVYEDEKGNRQRFCPALSKERINPRWKLISRELILRTNYPKGLADATFVFLTAEEAVMITLKNWAVEISHKAFGSSNVVREDSSFRARTTAEKTFVKKVNEYALETAAARGIYPVMPAPKVKQVKLQKIKVTKIFETRQLAQLGKTIKQWEPLMRKNAGKYQQSRLGMEYDDLLNTFRIKTANALRSFNRQKGCEKTYLEGIFINATKTLHTKALAKKRTMQETATSLDKMIFDDNSGHEIFGVENADFIDEIDRRLDCEHWLKLIPGRCAIFKADEKNPVLTELGV